MATPPRPAARPAAARPVARAAERIAKLLARAGVASRREIERMIAEGRIALDGEALTTPATLLKSLAGITVDGNPVAAPAPARLFAFHKPTGLLTTERDPAGRPTIYDRLPRDLPRVVPVGRLDLNTEGLLLLTTDGGLKRQLELPSSGVERSYRARAYGEVSQTQLEDLMHGVEVEGVRYGPIDANLERRTGANVWIELTLTEGKNREVRRVLEHLGLRVSRLIRTRYGPFLLGDLAVCEVVEIRQHDLVAFRKALALPPEKGQATPPEAITPAVNRAARRAEAAREREEAAPERPQRPAPPPRKAVAIGPRRPGDARPSRPAAPSAEPDGRRRRAAPKPPSDAAKAPKRARGDRQPPDTATDRPRTARPRAATTKRGDLTDRSAAEASKRPRGDRQPPETATDRPRTTRPRAATPKRGDLVDRPDADRPRARTQNRPERGRSDADRPRAEAPRRSPSPPPSGRPTPGKPRPGGGGPRRSGPARPRG